MWRLRVLGTGLAALALGSAVVTASGPATAPGPAAPARPAPARPAAARPAAAAPGSMPPGTVRRPTGACAAFAGAHQLAGAGKRAAARAGERAGERADAGGVTPAAWSGAGLVVPACGPVPGEGTGSGARDDPVYAYPGALWTSGYQCVEFSERYLYDRYGVTMDVLTNGDQVAAHYAANFPGLFMIVRNGTPHRAPADGDVLSLSATAGFDSAAGGHTGVVQSSSVDAAGDGTVTVIEENATASGVAVLTVAGWTVRYPGYRYIEWLTTTGEKAAAGYSPK
jgi:CHAP domain